MTDHTLRIAVDAGPLYGHRTGVGVAVDGMLTALGERDDVELLPYLVSSRSTPTPGHRRLPVPGIVASHLWSRGDRPHADRWLGGAELVHGTNYVAPPTALPTVISVYDCWFLRHPELASPLVRRSASVLRRAVARGAWIHASSDATAAGVTELLGTDRVRTIFLGAPASTMPASIPPDRPAIAAEVGSRPFVLAVATEERRKGMPLLVEAFAHLAGDDPDVALVLAGAPGDDSRQLDAAIGATESSAGERIHRIGAIDEPTKQWLLRHAAVLAYPSVDEGFGFPLLEGQAAGTPVVATRVGSVPEVAGDAVRFVDGRDVEDLAGAIDEVLHDGALRLGLIEAGYRNVARFRWADTADQLIELYQDAVGDAP